MFRLRAAVALLALAPVVVFPVASATTAQVLVALSSPTPYATAQTPSGIAVGDFNGDGNLDVAVANAGSDSISLWLGRGDGSLSTISALSLAPGSHPSALVAADFNGDGKMDLAVSVLTTANPASGQLLIFLGNGDGSSKIRLRIPLPLLAPSHRGSCLRPTSTTTAWSTSQSPLQRGSAYFWVEEQARSYRNSTPSRPALQEPWPWRLEPGWKTHLAIAGSTGGTPVTECLLLGNGDGSFHSGLSFSFSGSGPASMALADFNGDGRLDLAVSQAGAGVISVQLANGDGTFQPAATYFLAAGSSPAMIGAVDLNADGRADLFASNGSAGGVSVLTGNGDGTFQPSVSFAAGANSVALTESDLNGDARPDVLVLNQGDNSLSVLLDTTLAISASTLSFRSSR